MIQKKKRVVSNCWHSGDRTCGCCGLFILKKSAQSIPAKPAAEEIVETTEVRSLPGQLDNIPLFNSDSPEFCSQPFPQTAKKSPPPTSTFPFKGNLTCFLTTFLALR
jgi:hypothetical protein